MILVCYTISIDTLIIDHYDRVLPAPHCIIRESLRIDQWTFTKESDTVCSDKIWQSEIKKYDEDCFFERQQIIAHIVTNFELFGKYLNNGILEKIENKPKAKGKQFQNPC